MKKLAITSVVVFIALIGFIGLLYFLPGENCCVKQDGCEIHEQKCSGNRDGYREHGCGMQEKKCGDKQSCGKGHGHHESCVKGQGHHDGCGKGQGHHDGCGGGNEKRMVKEWKDADGKVHKEVKVIIGGEGNCEMMNSACPMKNMDHGGCCGCCMMKQGGGSCRMMEGDSMETDSVRVKVRGKL